MNLEERYNRYLFKINHSRTRIDNIKEWQGNLSDLDLKTLLAIYKAAQELIESIIDIVAMMVKDLKMGVSDDYTNIEQLYMKKIISVEDKELIKEANGLRNRIIHNYNTFIDKIAYIRLIEILPHLEDFIMVLEKWIENYFKQ